MYRLSITVVVAVVCALHVSTVRANSAGAPLAICTNNLTPEHGVAGQSSPVPYSFSGAASARAGESYILKLGGAVGFLGFAVQARDAKEQTVGQFNIIESNKSQPLTCSTTDDTLTHKKINRDDPIKSVEVAWIAPKDYKGKVRFVGTVAMDGGTYWIRKVVHEVEVA